MVESWDQIQQGDVTLIKLDVFPPGEVKIVSKQKCLVMHGEGGHSHVVEDDEAELIQIGEKMLLKLGKTATIVHEEHKEITLEPGIWEIGQINEYDYFSKMVKKVVD